MAPHFTNPSCCPASAFCLANRCKVIAVFIFTSLINNELEHLFVSILDFLFCKLLVCVVCPFSIGFIAFFLWIRIFTYIYLYRLYMNPLLVLYFSLLVLDTANISGFLFFKYVRLISPQGFCPGCPLCLLCSPRYLQAGLSGHLTLRWHLLRHIPAPKHSPLCHLVLLTLWPYHCYPVHSLFTCLLFVSILAESLLVTV